MSHQKSWSRWAGRDRSGYLPVYCANRQHKIDVWYEDAIILLLIITYRQAEIVTSTNEA